MLISAQPVEACDVDDFGAAGARNRDDVRAVAVDNGRERRADPPAGAAIDRGLVDGHLRGRRNAVELTRASVASTTPSLFIGTSMSECKGSALPMTEAEPKELAESGRPAVRPLDGQDR